MKLITILTITLILLIISPAYAKVEDKPDKDKPDKVKVSDHVVNTNNDDEGISMAPHMRGNQIFQDPDNLLVLTSNNNTVNFVWDMGNTLNINISTVDPTLHVFYKETHLGQVDTGLCLMTCPDTPTTFIFNVPIPEYLHYNTPQEIPTYQIGNWVYHQTRVWVEEE